MSITINIINEHFCRNLAKALLKLLKSSLNNCKNTTIFDYLKNNYHITLPELLDSLNEQAVIFYVRNHSTVIKINPVFKVKGVTIEKILQIIDYGTLYYKGLHITSKVFQSVKNNTPILYKVYIAKGDNFKLWA